MSARISCIAALGKDRVIGKENKLLWHIPDDMKRFKALTLGHPIIMGRKTFESILTTLGKPLPGRTNIVVTRDPSFLSRRGLDNFEGVIAVSSLEEALEKAKEIDQEEVFIGGGTQIYEQSLACLPAGLPLADRLYLTLIDDHKEGDTFFPAYEKEFTKVLSDEHREHNGINYRWLDLER